MHTLPWYDPVMATLTVQLPDPTVRRLEQQARAAGKPLEQLACEVLQAQASPDGFLAEMCGHVEREFSTTGMTEGQLAEQLEREDHAARGISYGER